MENRVSWKILRFLILIIFGIISQVSNAQQDEIIQMAGVLSTDRAIVSEPVILTFDLVLDSGRIKQEDKLVIELPKDQTVQWVTTIQLRCKINQPLSVKSCKRIDEYKIEMKVGSRSIAGSEVLKGTISQFKNPSSARTVTGIKFIVYDSIGIKKAEFLEGRISGFKPSPLDAFLTSSSGIVGQRDVALDLEVKAEHFTADGQVRLEVPAYYQGAGKDRLISSATPDCTGADMYINSCTFDARAQALLIDYSLDSGEDQSTPIFFTINSFNNPISPLPKTGFGVQTFDADGNIISENLLLQLDGINQPTTFSSARATFVKQNQVGQHGHLKFEIEMDIPVMKQCFFKIVFPPEFNLDQDLFEIDATGLFQRFPGQDMYKSINYNEKSLIIIAAQINKVKQVEGSLTFKSVLNPTYVNDTSSFQISLGVDSRMTQLIALKDTGIIVTDDMLKKGTVSNIKVRPFNTLVQAKGYYGFEFHPDSSLNQRTQIEIQLPSTIQISDDCVTDYASKQFFRRLVCHMDPVNNIIMLKKVFDEFSYDQVLPLSIAVGTLTNYEAVTNIGPFIVTAYSVFDEGKYLIDQGQIDHIVTLTPGLAQGVAPVQCTNPQTYSSDTTYRFALKFQHSIPEKGYIRVDLPETMKVPELGACYMFNYTEYLRDGSETYKRVECVSGDENHAEIQIDKITAGEEIGFTVDGFRNPRATGQDVQFQISSWNHERFMIDMSSFDQNLIIAMETIGDLYSIAIQPVNETNGATTTYKLTVSANTPVGLQDEVIFDFPRQISLPVSYDINCEGDQIWVNTTACRRKGERRVHIKLTDLMSDDPEDIIPIGQEFSVFLHNITNSYSTKPSSSFTNFLLRDPAARNISEYTQKNVIVTTNKPGLIQEFELDQTNREPQALAIYTIKIYTNNPLPPTTALAITVPDKMEISPDADFCLITTRDRNQVGVTGNLQVDTEVVPKCQFSGYYELKMTDGFEQLDSLYSGSVKISFQAKNPLETMSLEDSITLKLYDGPDFQHPIDEVLQQLNPAYTCNPPCQTCTLEDINNCTSCRTGFYDQKYLQRYDEDGYRTCKRKCDDGYTYSSLITPYVCKRCHQSCKTCRYGGTDFDAEYCLTCNERYRVFWQSGAKCYSPVIGCPYGTYLIEGDLCLNCPYPCKDCQDANRCVVCDQDSYAPYLQNGQCVSQCESSKTPVKRAFGSSCEDCIYPCRTCAPGDPERCLSCLGATYVFAGKCLDSCPDGTFTDSILRACTGCLAGCAECDDYQQDVCLVCDKGLRLFNDTCVEVCPEGFMDNEAKDKCIVYVDPFGFIAILPFSTICAVLCGLSFYSYMKTNKRTNFIQCFIAFTSTLSTLALIHTYIEVAHRATGIPKTTMIQSTLLFMGLQMIFNLIFLLAFCSQVDDMQFNKFIKQERKMYSLMIFLTAIINFNLFRLFFARLKNRNWTDASAIYPQAIEKPLRGVNIGYGLLLCIPCTIANIYFLGNKFEGTPFWDSQLQMSAFEVCLLQTICTALLIYERIYLKSKYVMFLPTPDNPYFMGKFDPLDFEEIQTPKTPSQSVKKQKPQRQPIPSIDEQIYMPHEKRLYIQETLNSVMKTVKNNYGTGLHDVSYIDRMMEEEVRTRMEKTECKSDPGVKHSVPEQQYMDMRCPRDENVSDWSFNDLNQSFPGLNPQDEVLENNGEIKRIKFFEWLDECERQRSEALKRVMEEKMRREKFKDAGNNYDNDAFDNCGFEAKPTKWPLGAQTDDLQKKPMYSMHSNTYVPYPDDYVPPITEDLQTQAELQGRPRDREMNTVIRKKPDFTPIDHKLADFERRQYEKQQYALQRIKNGEDPSAMSGSQHSRKSSRGNIPNWAKSSARSGQGGILSPHTQGRMSSQVGGGPGWYQSNQQSQMFSPTSGQSLNMMSRQSSRAQDELNVVREGNKKFGGKKKKKKKSAKMMIEEGEGVGENDEGEEEGLEVRKKKSSGSSALMNSLGEHFKSKLSTKKSKTVKASLDDEPEDAEGLVSPKTVKSRASSKSSISNFGDLLSQRVKAKMQEAKDEAEKQGIALNEAELKAAKLKAEEDANQEIKEIQQEEGTDENTDEKVEEGEEDEYDDYYDDQDDYGNDYGNEYGDEYGMEFDPEQMLASGKSHYSIEPSIISDDEIVGDELGDKFEKERVPIHSLKLKDDSRTLMHNSLRSLFMAPEPEPNPNKFIKHVKLMKTLELDKSDPRKTPIFPEGKPISHEVPSYHSSRDNKDSSNTPASKRKQKHAVLEVNIEEETISQCEEFFYNIQNSKDDELMKSSIDDNASVRTQDLDAPARKDRSKDLNAFLREDLLLNKRNFNVHEVLGNFPLDHKGRIVNRKSTIWSNKFRDADGQLVNDKGYLINEKTGAIRSRYTFEDICMPQVISGSGGTTGKWEAGELPMPFRLEKWNFNPHQIMGNFQYDIKAMKPIFLKNKYGQLTDKNYRLVNQHGFLINERDDVIDEKGHVIFNKEQLTSSGNIPPLLNYKGKSFKIQEVTGQLQRHDRTKEILVGVDTDTGRIIDDLGRFVSPTGYLIDQQGNIISNKDKSIIFNFWELIHNEPPKIFPFSEFSLGWIRGFFRPGKKPQRLKNSKDDHLFDEMERLVNQAGYLIDSNENILDQFGHVVFLKELLGEVQGQESQIPPIYLSGQLDKPQMTEQIGPDSPRQPQEISLLSESQSKMSSKRQPSDEGRLAWHDVKRQKKQAKVDKQSPEQEQKPKVEKVQKEVKEQPKVVQAVTVAQIFDDAFALKEGDTFIKPQKVMAQRAINDGPADFLKSNNTSTELAQSSAASGLFLKKLQGKFKGQMADKMEDSQNIGMLNSKQGSSRAYSSSQQQKRARTVRPAHKIMGALSNYIDWDAMNQSPEQQRALPPPLMSNNGSKKGSDKSQSPTKIMHKFLLERDVLTPTVNSSGWPINRSNAQLPKGVNDNTKHSNADLKQSNVDLTGASTNTFNNKTQSRPGTQQQQQQLLPNNQNAARNQSVQKLRMSQNQSTNNQTRNILNVQHGGINRGQSMFSPSLRNAGVAMSVQGANMNQVLSDALSGNHSNEDPVLGGIFQINPKTTTASGLVNNIRDQNLPNVRKNGFLNDYVQQNQTNVMPKKTGTGASFSPTTKPMKRGVINNKSPLKKNNINGADLPLSSRNDLKAEDMILRITGNLFKQDSDAAMQLFGQGPKTPNNIAQQYGKINNIYSQRAPSNPKKQQLRK